MILTRFGYPEELFEDQQGEHRDPYLLHDPPNRAESTPGSLKDDANFPKLARPSAGSATDAPPHPLQTHGQDQPFPIDSDDDEHAQASTHLPHAQETDLVEELFSDIPDIQNILTSVETSKNFLKRTR
jgi:hypothetical protein